jgi:ATP-binding cassette, subfamily B, bacterial MsbA
MGYWKLSIPALLLSFLYVSLNAATLWIVASLIQTVFSPEEAVVTVEVHSVNDFLKNITRSMIAGLDPVAALNRLAIIILIVFTLKNIFLYLKNILFARISLSIINDMRNQLYAHISRQTMSYFDRSTRGEFISIIMNDVTGYRQAIMVFFGKLFIEPLNILFIIILLFIISWKFTLLVFLIFPIFALIFVKVGASIRRKGRRSFDQIGKITAILHQMFGGIRLIKTFNRVEEEIENFIKNTQRYFKLQYRQQILQAFSSPLSEMIGVMAGVLLFAIGGRLVFSGDGIDSEDFIRYMVLLFSTFQPLKQLTDVNAILQNGMAAAERIYKVLDEPIQPDEDTDAIEKKEFTSEIAFHDVSFRYDTQLVLQNINFSLNKGETLALVGSSGSGKSTIADLMIRFYSPESGAIEIDGLPLPKIRRESLLRLIGIVSQDVILFNDTIRANIAYGSPEADEADILKAAEIANAAAFIQELDEGWDTIVGDQGVKLSGGQKQRISIARAILRNPPILILDEATSSLDNESERLVQESLEKLMQGRTTLIIAHRLSSIRAAQKILVLDKGQIVCKGSHSRLIEDCSVYQKLYQQQMEIEAQNASHT